VLPSCSHAQSSLGKSPCGIIQLHEQCSEKDDVHLNMCLSKYEEFKSVCPSLNVLNCNLENSKGKVQIWTQRQLCWRSLFAALVNSHNGSC
jgi:hypothetical protein